MYVPKHFSEARVDVMHRLIRTCPFGTLVVMTPDGLEANHLPFVRDGAPAPYGTLRAHVARANALWSTYSPEVEALVIFHGPQAYISPSWYASKRETGQVVPTWNYAVVHAYGALRVVHERDWLLNQIEALTNQQERALPAPWRVADAPAAYVEGLVKAIVGIEIEIARLIGKWKLSQNRSEADRASMVSGLQAEGGEVARPLLRLLEEHGIA